MTNGNRAVLGMLDEIRGLAWPVSGLRDLDRLVHSAGVCRFVGIGEASPGTHEYRTMRARLSMRLIEEQAYSWIGVEADWADCWRLNRWVRGESGLDTGVHAVLAGAVQWPNWTWANEEMAGFLDWLRGWNLERPMEERVGFHGLDLYSLWHSLRTVISWLHDNRPDAVPSAMRAWKCFLPHPEDPPEYAWSTRLVPESSEPDVVALLAAAHNRTLGEQEPGSNGNDVRDALRTAAAAADAEHYYRILLRGNRESWNIRDRHMADTADRLSTQLGPASKGIIWGHNSHLGDARATDMARDGLVNVGQLLRQRHGPDAVILVGMGSHHGTVMAADSWGAAGRVLSVPAARTGSHEDLLHRALGAPSLLQFGRDRSGPWLSARLGQRAIGEVYGPDTENGNYVPTCMGGRYDALIWLEQTTALRPLHQQGQPRKSGYEGEPAGS